ncbi:MFS transporter [Chloroflexota bacterium]
MAASWLFRRGFKIKRRPTIKKPHILSFLAGLLPLFILAHFAHHLLGALLTPLLPFIRDEFALDYTQAGLLLSVYTWTYGIGQLPAGWLADRVGPRLLLTIGISGVALAGLLVGLSTTYILMAVFLVLLGLAGGGYHPSAAPLISSLVKPEKRGSILGIHQIGGTVSFFLAPLIAVGIATHLGWRGSFIAVAVPTLIFGIVFYMLLGHRGQSRTIESKRLGGDMEPASTQSQMRRLVAFLTLGIVNYVFIYSAISFIPLFAVDHLMVSEGAAAILLTVVHSAGLWGGPLGGYLSDRLGRVTVMLVAMLIAGPAFYFLSISSYGFGIYAVLLVIGLSTYITMPVSESFIIREVPEHRRSMVLGIYYFASRGGGGLVMPVLGYLIDQYWFSASFTLVAAALTGVTLICALFLWKSRTLD